MKSPLGLQILSNPLPNGTVTPDKTEVGSVFLGSSLELPSNKPLGIWHCLISMGEKVEFKSVEVLPQDKKAAF